MAQAKIGRPPKFKSPQELQEKIDAYFADMEEQKRPLTVTGLALALDTSRECLLNYSNKEAYFDTIKKAKLKIQNFAEESLWASRNPAGVIFNLKNNWKWMDKHEVGLSGDIGIDIESRLARALESNKQPATDEEESP